MLLESLLRFQDKYNPTSVQQPKPTQKPQATKATPKNHTEAKSDKSHQSHLKNNVLP